MHMLYVKELLALALTCRQMYVDCDVPYVWIHCKEEKWECDSDTPYSDSQLLRHLPVGARLDTLKMTDEEYRLTLDNAGNLYNVFLVACSHTLHKCTELLTGAISERSSLRMVSVRFVWIEPNIDWNNVNIDSGIRALIALPLLTHLTIGPIVNVLLNSLISLISSCAWYLRVWC
jgi:hypothetical protein